MSAEIERAVLAAAIESPAAFERIAEHLSPEDFAEEGARVAFEACAALRGAGRAVDVPILAALLERSKRWPAAEFGEPYPYLERAVITSHGAGALEGYIAHMRSEAAGRAILSYARELAEIAYDRSLDGEQKEQRMQQAMPALGAGAGAGATIEYGAAAKAAVRDALRRREGEIQGVTSGIAPIDELTGGWDPGTLIVIGGRPSMGKSLLLMDLAHAAAENAGRVLVYSLEMTAANLAARGIANLGTVDFGEFRRGRIDEHMETAIIAAQRRMAAMPITIDDRPGITVDQLRLRAKVAARRERPALIVTDYLTLLGGVGENRTAQVGYVSRSLKALAKELECPVICAAQLNRGVESRPDKRPTLSDLRDSGEIEQDADVMAAIYRHEVYNPDTPKRGIAELIFLKQRNGEVGTVYLEFDGRRQRFREHVGPVPPDSDEADDEHRGHTARRRLAQVVRTADRVPR